MNLVLIGALLGGLAGAGLLMAILASPPLRRPTLSDRIAPYLTDAAKPSRLLTGSAGGGTVTAFGRITAPLVRDAVRFIDKVLGGATTVTTTSTPAISSIAATERASPSRAVLGSID
jgi:tight adherence protein C